MRLRLNLEVYLSSTTAEENDLAKPVRRLVTDDLREGGSSRIRIPVNAVDQEVTFPGLASASFLFLRTVPVDDTLTPTHLFVKLGDVGNDPWAVYPFGTTREGILVLTTGGVDSIYVSNPSATVEMYVHLVSVGDPV